MLLLIPSHSLDDFPLERHPQDANQFLSAWSALYHPALLEWHGKLPTWDKASNPNQDDDSRLVVIPPCCEWQVPGEWRYSRNPETVVIDHASDREEIVSEALHKLGLVEHGFAPWFVDAFYAAGMAYFLSELLTRQRRYMSMLNEFQFRDNLLKAVAEYRNGDFEESRLQLRQAFELLQQSKEYFYPVQAFFLDLTLTASTTLAARLRHVLEHEEHVDLVLPSAILEKIAEEHVETLELLKKAVAGKRVSIIADDLGQMPMPMMRVMNLVEHLIASRRHYETLTGQMPEIYMRGRYGLLPNLPSILSRIGCKGMLLFSTEGWKINEKHQSRIDWTAPDGRKICTLVRYPIDANAHEQYLLLPQILGKILESDYAPTVTFAHYPGLVQRWLKDLKTIVEYAPTMGRFLNIIDYFETTRYSGKSDRLDPSLFKSNYLVRSVEDEVKNPITLWRDMHRQNIEKTFTIGLMTLTASITGKNDGFDPGSSLSQTVESFKNAITENENNDNETGYLVVNPSGFSRRVWLDVSGMETIPDKSETVLFAREENGRKEVVAEVPGMGYSWIGPGTPVMETSKEEPKKKLFQFFSAGRPQPSLPPLVEQTEQGYFLRNEIFELHVDPVSGAIRSVFLHGKRGNRFAQQLAYRFGDPERESDTRSPEDINFGYSIMAADRFEVFQSGPLMASLVVSGRMMHVDGSVLATFDQTIAVTLGKNIIEQEITITPGVLPGRNVWNNYYAARIAWGNTLLEPFLGIATGTFPATTKYMEAPFFVDFRDGDESITICGGHPYQRRIDDNRLDTLLLVEGEETRTFQLGIAIDAEYPMVAALDFLSPVEPLIIRCGKPKIPSAWLFALEAKNVVIERWEPIFQPMEPKKKKLDFSVREWGYGYYGFAGEEKKIEEKPDPLPRFDEVLRDVSRPMIGMRFYLLETEGRKVDLPFRSFRKLAKAICRDFYGEEEKIFTLTGDGAIVPIGEHELLPVDIYFQ